MNDIAMNIKKLRKEKGLSHEDFAQALYVTRQTVSAWERGLSRPGLETIQQMAEVLGVEPERLLYGAGREPIYRRVSFGPVFAMIPLFYIVSMFLPFLGGQLFLAMTVMFCYCSLKDEIRNAEYYKKHDPDEDMEDWNSGFQMQESDPSEGPGE